MIVRGDLHSCHHHQSLIGAHSTHHSQNILSRTLPAATTSCHLIPSKSICFFNQSVSPGGKEREGHCRDDSLLVCRKDATSLFNLLFCSHEHLTEHTSTGTSTKFILESLFKCTIGEGNPVSDQRLLFKDRIYKWTTLGIAALPRNDYSRVGRYMKVDRSTFKLRWNHNFSTTKSKT